jgi:transglutaminase-like putative cysteine protease
MIYRIVHKTSYKYKQPVSIGNHVVCLTPRSLLRHKCIANELCIRPTPATISERVDYFGNRVKFFSIQEPHEELVVEARSEVVMNGDAPPWPDVSPAWDKVVRSLPAGLTAEAVDAYQFVFESPRIRTNAEFASYAAQSFTAGRPLAEALLDLTKRIHADFKFDKEATNVRTKPEEAFRKRRGVCQDFAHLQIACLRSLKLPARYVSGYLRTYRIPGKPEPEGCDVSHAWVSAYCPGGGWLDVDPTNNVVPTQNHVTIAWGRDYGDVSPLRGLILGGRDHTLKVQVDIQALE